MFWIILGIIGIIASIILAIINKDFSDFIESFFYSLIGCALSLLLCGVFIGSFIPTDEVYETSDIQIYSLVDTPGTEGSFFLGSGSIDSQLKYYYITKDENGAKEVHNINAEGIKLYDNEKETPYIKILKMRNSNGFLRFFFYTEDITYEIHIPPNSIKYNYNIDLE